MKGCISVINAGSSSIKFSLFDQVEAERLRQIFTGQVDGIGVAPRFKAQNAKGEAIAEQTWPNAADVNHESLMKHIINWIRTQRQELGLELFGVGHRVVHGGSDYSAPVRVDETVLQHLEKYVPLAPLHQPHNLNPIRTVAKLGPDIPQVACFDTAFHATNPPEAQIFGIPRELTRGGGASLRIPRALLRVHLPQTAGAGCSGCRGAGGGGPSGQRCQHVRPEQRAKHCQHPGVFGPGRADHGNPFGESGSRCDPVSCCSKSR